MELIILWGLLILCVVLIVLAICAIFGDNGDDDTPSSGSGTVDTAMLLTTQQAMVVTMIL